jgi:hypothetical protein
MDHEVAFMANELWGDADGQLIFHHPYGKGHVYWGAPLNSVLAEKKIHRDVDYTKPHVNTYLSWIHRKTNDADIYFISNLRNQKEEAKIQFRVHGKKPELWHADTGKSEEAEYVMEGGVTTVSVTLNPEQSVFVVFHNPTTVQAKQLAKPIATMVANLGGPWQVNFPANLGAPEKITLEKLISLSDHPEDGVKYFGGTASYHKEFTITKDWFKPGARFILDLGKVKDIAEVSVNGQLLGTLWKLPYEMDITSALKTGTNKIEIKVTNQWTNRIAGDAVKPDQKILSGAGLSFGGVSTTLIESGLIGPVTVQQILQK